MARAFLINAVLLCFGACSHAPDVAPTRPSAVTARYVVEPLDNLRGARVRVCLEGDPVAELVPIHPSGTALVRQDADHGDRLDVRDDRIRLVESPPSCVDYQTRFERSLLQPKGGPAIVVSQAQWLWRPHPFPDQLDATVQFMLRNGERVSHPWPKGEGIDRLDKSAFFADAYSVFGDFDRRELQIAGVEVEIAHLGVEPSDDQIDRWLGRAVNAASSLGSFPRARIQFVITPVDVPDDDVVFGMLRRGGGASVLLVPSANATREGLDHDWVAIHELSHLWLPRFAPQDRWLSEGFATYLQEVLPARCGFQAESRAWRRLAEGFDRGRRSGTGRALSAESRDMDQTGAYFRVYWAGAAFALEADMRLREANGGDESLLDAIARASQLWEDGVGVVSGDAFLEALDDSGALARLAAEYRTSSEFPDTGFLTSVETAALRKQIMERDAGCGLSDESSR
jgi:hypothetical protein